MAEKTRLRFTAKIGALPEERFAVADFTLEEALNRPFSLLLNLACARTDTDFAAVPDQPCHLKICYHGELQHPLRGIISEFSRGDSGFHRTRCTVLVRPALWHASLRRSSRIFQAEHPRHITGRLHQVNNRPPHALPEHRTRTISITENQSSSISGEHTVTITGSQTTEIGQTCKFTAGDQKKMQHKSWEVLNNE